MNARAGDLQQQLQDTAEALQTAEENHREIAKRLVEAERGLTEVMAALDHLRGENQQRRAAYMQQMRLAAALGNETSALESQVAAAAAARERCGDRIAELDARSTSCNGNWTTCAAAARHGPSRPRSRPDGWPTPRINLHEASSARPPRQNELSELRQRHSGAAERAAVLEELVDRQEGLSAGVKEVLARAANPADPVFRTVCGLVADSVPRQRRGRAAGRDRPGPSRPARRGHAERRSCSTTCRPSRAASAAAWASSGSREIGQTLGEGAGEGLLGKSP